MNKLVLAFTSLILSTSVNAGFIDVADYYSLETRGDSVIRWTNEIIASDGIGLPLSRGYAEFDLSTITPGSYNFTLHLPDSGGMTPHFRGGISSTDIFSYVGDGSITVGDWGAGASLLLSTVRPHLGGESTFDITAAVNSALGLGTMYFGLEFISTFGQDAFGFAGEGPGWMHISYELASTTTPPPPTPTGVPLPATLWLLGSALFSLSLIKRKR